MDREERRVQENISLILRVYLRREESFLNVTSIQIDRQLNQVRESIEEWRNNHD